MGKTRIRTEEQRRAKMAERLNLLNRVFTPASPIEDQSFFAGRSEQLFALMDLPKQPGLHAIMYGERGVGKTSLANIARLLLFSLKIQAVKCSCDSTDTYESLWEKVFLEIQVTAPVEERMGIRNRPPLKEATVPLASVLSDFNYASDKVLFVLKQLPQSIVIILDEFDRLNGSFNQRVFADTLKNISDNVQSITFIIVGVGDSVSALISEHASIERNLKQIHIPVMNNDELRDIITKGIKKLDMTMDYNVILEIITYSCGYPHYTHLLAYNACHAAIQSGTANVNESHFETAIKKSINDAHESLRIAYREATLATQHNIYKEVLWACAATELDENGTFQAKDLQDPLSNLLQRPVTVTSYVSHLGKFCSPERDNVLIVLGKPGRRRYKFKNPLMRAFVLLHMRSARKTIPAHETF